MGAVGRIESGIVRIKDDIKQKEKDLIRSFVLSFKETYDFVSQSEKLILQLN